MRAIEKHLITYLLSRVLVNGGVLAVSLWVVSARCRCCVVGLLSAVSARISKTIRAANCSTTTSGWAPSRSQSQTSSSGHGSAPPHPPVCNRQVATLLTATGRIAAAIYQTAWIYRPHAGYSLYFTVGREMSLLLGDRALVYYVVSWAPRVRSPNGTRSVRPFWQNLRSRPTNAHAYRAATVTVGRICGA